METDGWFESQAESSDWRPQPATHYRPVDDRSVPGSAAAAAWDQQKAELRDMASAPLEDLDQVADSIRRTNKRKGISMTDDQIRRAALDVQQNGFRRAAEDLAEMEWDDLLKSAVRFDSRIGSYICASHPRANEVTAKWPLKLKTPMPPELTPIELHPVVVKATGKLGRVCWSDNPVLEQLRATMEQLKSDTGRIGISRYEPPSGQRHG
jgi:hypothetical protein